MPKRQSTYRTPRGTGNRNPVAPQPPLEHNPVYPCPSCGRRDSYKWMREVSYMEYWACECGHAPRVFGLPSNGEDMEVWAKRLDKEYQEALAADAGSQSILDEAQQNGRSLTLAELRDQMVTARRVTDSRARASVAMYAVAMKAEIPEGVISLHLPSLGILESFAWGDYLKTPSKPVSNTDSN